MSQGKLIVIEGLDGSGKATQSQLLVDRLNLAGIKAIRVTFPDYNSDSSALIKMYLSGEFGNSPEDVNPYAASSFYAVDRYASYKTKWKKFYDDGYVIVADRYTTSNLVHQCSKLQEDKWHSFILWLNEYEYELLKLPCPDQVFYLNVGNKESQKLLSKRYNGDDSKKDIHESNKEYLKKCKSAAEFCAKICNWTTINCIKNGVLRTIDSINDDICFLLDLKDF